MEPPRRVTDSKGKATENLIISLSDSASRAKRCQQDGMRVSVLLAEEKQIFIKSKNRTGCARHQRPEATGKSEQRELSLHL